jgi:tetratricopeptide (TPR) repeat protein
MGRRIAVVLAVVLALPQAFAQPADPGGDIEMDPQDAGSGSGSAAKPPPPTTPTTPPETEDAPITKDPKVAKKWQSAAVQLVQKGDYLARKGKADEAKAQYDNAVTAYEKAIEASDDLNSHYDLGLVLEKLGKLDLAATHLRTAATAKAGVKPDVQKKAAAKFDELSTKVGLVTLTVNTVGATISIGGAEIAKTPLADALILMPGTYTLSFAADGYQPKDTEIKVEAGSESERAIELEPIKITVSPIRPDTDTATAKVGPKAPSLVPVYVGGGVAVGLGTIGIVTGILAVSQHSTFVAASSKKADRADAKANGMRLAHVTDALFVSALAAGGFTAYWYFFKYRPAKKKFGEAPAPSNRDPNAPDISKIDVVPWVQPSGGGFSVAGSF